MKGIKAGIKAFLMIDSSKPSNFLTFEAAKCRK